MRVLLSRDIDGAAGDVHYLEMAGISSETKPTTNVATGSKFYEVDTDTNYVYDEDSGDWTEVPSVVDPEAIADAVEDWLDDHPEATTTVEDGAITYAKLNSSLKDTVDDVSDLKNAFNDADEAYITCFDDIYNRPGYINSSGNHNNDSSFSESIKIPVNVGDQFEGSLSCSSASWVCTVAAFNGDTFVSSASLKQDFSSYTVPEGVTHLIFCSKGPNNDTMPSVVSLQKVKYKTISGRLNATDEKIQQMENVPFTLTSGWITSTGAIQAADATYNEAYTDLHLSYPGTKIITGLTSEEPGVSSIRFAAYKKDGTFLSQVQKTFTNANTSVCHEWTMPENAYGYRFAFRQYSGDTKKTLWIKTLCSLQRVLDESKSKINEPASDGSNGQVLITDGLGGRTWGTPQWLSPVTGEKAVELGLTLSDNIRSKLYEFSNAKANIVQGAYSAGVIVSNTKAVSSNAKVAVSVGDIVLVTVQPGFSIRIGTYATMSASSALWYVDNNTDGGLIVTVPESKAGYMYFTITSTNTLTPSDITGSVRVYRFLAFADQSDIDEAITGFITKDQIKEKTIQILKWVQGNSTYIYSDDVLAFPRDGKYKIHLNSGYTARISAGPLGTSLTNSAKLSDGDTYEKPGNYWYFRVWLEKSPSGNISPSDASSTGFYITYEDEAPNIIGSSAEQSKLLNSARLRFLPNGNNNTISKYPVLLHTSDVHGDLERVRRFLQFAEHEGVDAACISGDIVYTQIVHGLAWFHDMISKTSAFPVVCLGNHDVYDPNNTLTDAQIYTAFFDPIADKIGNETGKSWYYVDISSKNLRIIVLDLYEAGSSDVQYTHMTETQLGWLVTTLQQTPNNYGVVLMYHSMLRYPEADSTYDKFFQSQRRNGSINNGITGAPIYDIIDAFIGRTTLSQTYTQTGSPSSISVSANFSSVDNSVEFIAHMTGHTHMDGVSYVPDASQTQLMLNVICGQATYGYDGNSPYACDLNDIGRNKNDSTQDCFNAYVIDRENGTVKVIRIGNDVTYDLTKRDYMVIPYK